MSANLPPERAERLREDLRRWRRHLHMHPELSFQERETTAYLIEQLRSLDIQIETPTATGLVATIEGATPGRTIALRADIDALPLMEENDVEYRSRHDGVMHACGHDGHTAILLGVTQVLSEQRAQLRGTVRLLFQHAEERHPGGAQELIAAGALEGVDVAIGLHLISYIPIGRAGIRAGAMQASADSFTVDIEGKGGHGAYPHDTIDATVVCAQLVMNLQTIVSRRVNPLEPAVISVGRMTAGTASNVIAQRARIEGTVRAFSEDIRQLLRNEIERITKHTCEQAGATYQLNYAPGYPPLINDRDISEELRSAAAGVLGEREVFELTPGLGADDFAYYAREVPAAFLFLGSGSPGLDFPHHHPRFDLDERSLEHGAAIMLGAVARLLAR